MSILAYTGLPGAGKSYAVVEHQILPALKAGRRVCTNIPMHLELVLAKFPNAELVELPLEAVTASPEKIYEYVTPGTVLVLDEVWRIFPAGLRADKVPEPFRKLLAEHRHMVNAKGEAAQLVLVTQDLAQVAAFARQLVEQTFRTVKLSSVGIRGGYRLDVFNGPITGPNPPIQSRLREVYGKYSKDVWQFYKSHTMSESAAQGADERLVDRRGSLLRSPALLIAAAIVVLGLVFVFPRVTALVSKDGLGHLAGSASPGAAEPPPATTTEPGAAPSIVPLAGSPGEPEPPGPVFSRWRIAAVIQVLEDPKRSRVIVTDGTRNQVIPYEGACYSNPWGQVFCNFLGTEIGETDLVGSPNTNRPGLSKG